MNPAGARRLGCMMGMYESASVAFPTAKDKSVRRVLVVDDSRAQRRTLALMLRRWGYEVEEAEDARIGLEKCDSFVPDLILSDWMMPGMTGIEFCRAFRQIKRDSYGYFILLTSKTEKSAVASGLDAGADDFLTKPVNGDELRARITAGERILAMEREMKVKNDIISNTLDKLQQVHASIDRDLQQARVLQKSLMPQRSVMFGKNRISVMLHSCGHVGGDLAGMFDTATGDFGLFSLDVSGHGITSAMLTARVAGYLSSKYPDENLALCRSGRDYGFLPPQFVASKLNGRMLGQKGVSEYLTLAYMQVAALSGRTRFVQAGHPSPLLMRANGDYSFLGDGGLPVGLIEDAPYHEHHLILSPGDRVLLYSDGISEALRPDGTMLDETGLLDLVRAIPPTVTGPDFLDALFEALKSETQTNGAFDDDVSAAFLEYAGP